MRKFLASLLTVAAAVALVHAQGAGSRLDGNWMMIADAGEQLPDEFFEKLQARLIVKNGEYEQKVQGNRIEAGKFKVDMTRNPATIDFEIVEGMEKGNKQLGIFKFEGDKLIMAIGRAGSPVRPRDFQPTKEIQVPVFKRSK